MKKISIYTDGGARGNPGPAGIGVVIKDESGEIILQDKEYIGEATNNQAEYRALILALEKAKELGASEVDCFLDSELVVEQVKQNYKIKNAELAKLFVKIWNLSQSFVKITYTHIPREQNSMADSLVNLAIDENI